MESTQRIKSRIKSIEGTRQITRSMRLVSTAKMQRSRESTAKNQPFRDETRRLAALARACMYGESHPYLGGRAVGNTLMVVLSGDRGLCGGHNVGVIRHAMTAIDELDHPAKVITIGAKAGEYFRRRRIQPVRAFTGISDSPFYSEAAEIARVILDLFDSGQADQVLMCCTEFESMFSQHPRIQRLLPVDDGDPADASVSFEPADASFLRGVIPFYLASAIYGALLESSLCEQCARIVSMDGAVRNADEMIRRLTLRFNQARQGVITREISEIVSGADAVSSNHR